MVLVWCLIVNSGQWSLLREIVCCDCVGVVGVACYGRVSGVVKSVVLRALVLVMVISCDCEGHGRGTVVVLVKKHHTIKRGCFCQVLFLFFFML